MIDFTDYPKSNTIYGGSERKQGIIINNNEYMLKFQSADPFDTRYNHISEYIGSHIFAMLGFDVHETFLGTYEGKNVVACKSFIKPGEEFVPFNEVGESSLERDREIYQYSYEDIMQMLRANVKLTHVEESIDSFWQIYIVDALLGNFDRHGYNWGFIKQNNQYRLAPVFDNGSCLYSKLGDENQIKQILNSQEETEKRIFTFPTSQIKLNGNKSSYYEVINSLQFKECNDALKTIFERINLPKIFKFIELAEAVPKIRKDLYIHMIKNRYKIILQNAYEKLENRNG